MKKTIAEQIQDASEDFDNLQHLIYMNEKLIQTNLYGNIGVGNEIYIFNDDSNIILNFAHPCSNLEDTYEINVSKKRLKEISVIVKDSKKVIKKDNFYSLNRDWTDEEMDLYL